MNQRGKLKLTVFVVLLIGMCAMISYIVANWASRTQEWRHDRVHGHEWLRNEIGLDNTEFAAINAFEEDYRRQRADLLQEYAARIGQLRGLLSTQSEFSPEVQHAIHELHQVHGELQELSIRHYFDMFSVLPAEKQQLLRQVAVDALSEPE
jgi:hypothetical protein